MRYQQSLVDDDFIRLHDLFSAEVTQRLTHEAELQRLSARPWSTDEYILSGGGQLSSPRAHQTAGPGPVLRGLHEGTHVVGLLRQMTGQYFFPTRVSYLFYGPGDFIGLHTDIDPCQVTLLTSVLGSPDPLMVHPDLAGIPRVQLLELSQRTAGRPPGGVAVSVPRGGLLVLRGSRIPHHRPTVRHSCGTATLCYAALA